MQSNNPDLQNLNNALPKKAPIANNSNNYVPIKSRLHEAPKRNSNPQTQNPSKSNTFGGVAARFEPAQRAGPKSSAPARPEPPRPTGGLVAGSTHNPKAAAVKANVQAKTTGVTSNAPNSTNALGQRNAVSAVPKAGPSSSTNSLPSSNINKTNINSVGKTAQPAAAPSIPPTMPKITSVNSANTVNSVQIDSTTTSPNVSTTEKMSSPLLPNKSAAEKKEKVQTITKTEFEFELRDSTKKEKEKASSPKKKTTKKKKSSVKKPGGDGFPNDDSFPNDDEFGWGDVDAFPDVDDSVFPDFGVDIGDIGSKNSTNKSGGQQKDDDVKEQIAKEQNYDPDNSSSAIEFENVTTNIPAPVPKNDATKESKKSLSSSKTSKKSKAQTKDSGKDDIFVDFPSAEPSSSTGPVMIKKTFEPETIQTNKAVSSNTNPTDAYRVNNINAPARSSQALANSYALDDDIDHIDKLDAPDFHLPPPNRFPIQANKEEQAKLDEVDSDGDSADEIEGLNNGNNANDSSNIFKKVWECAHCSFHNQNLQATVCEICGKSRNGAAEIVEDNNNTNQEDNAEENLDFWACAVCSFHNPNLEAAQCEMCFSDRPQNTQLGSGVELGDSVPSPNAQNAIAAQEYMINLHQSGGFEGHQNQQNSENMQRNNADNSPSVIQSALAAQNQSRQNTNNSTTPIGQVAICPMCGTPNPVDGENCTACTFLLEGAEVVDDPEAVSTRQQTELQNSRGPVSQNLRGLQDSLQEEFEQAQSMEDYRYQSFREQGYNHDMAVVMTRHGDDLNRHNSVDQARAHQERMETTMRSLQSSSRLWEEMNHQAQVGEQCVARDKMKWTRDGRQFQNNKSTGSYFKVEGGDVGVIEQVFPNGALLVKWRVKGKEFNGSCRRNQVRVYDNVS